MHAEELTLARMERFVSDYHSQFKRPCPLQAVSVAFNKHCTHRLGRSAGELMEQLADANRVHSILLASGSRHFVPIRLWERLSDAERVGLVNSAGRK